MISFKVKVYQYSTGLSNEFQISGYNYSVSAQWINVSATALSQSQGALNVRFGSDGTSQCVYIGELASTWSYPQVVVTDFIAGYSNYTAALWASGWSVSFEASAFAGVSTSTVAYATLNTNTSPIPAGTVMLFAQTAAPTGWTKSTAHDNKALRVVSGTASSGGTVAFTTAFASKSVSGSLSNTTATNQAQTATNIAVTATNQAQTQGGTVGSTTLDTTQIPSHRHTVPTGSSTLDGVYVHEARVAYGSENTSFVGGGLSHNHTFSGSSHNHTQDAHNHTQNSHNHTQDAHTHTFTGTAIDLAVQYVDVIIATKN
jgi:hypothetical protein